MVDGEGRIIKCLLGEDGTANGEGGTSPECLWLFLKMSFCLFARWVFDVCLGFFQAFRSRRRRLLLSSRRIRRLHRRWLHHPMKLTESVRRVEGLTRGSRRDRQPSRHRRRLRSSHRPKSPTRSWMSQRSPRVQRFHRFLMTSRALRCLASRISAWWRRSLAWWCPRWALGSLESAAAPQCPAACFSRRFPCPTDQ